jgi:hypothetical protein
VHLPLVTAVVSVATLSQKVDSGGLKMVDLFACACGKTETQLGKHRGSVFSA